MNKLKLNLFKKLLSVALTSTFLLSFNIVPAKADGYYDGVNGTVNCKVADEVSGDFTITANVVVSHSICEGVAEIPVGVTSIGDSAFSSATYLTSVIIPSSVTSIGNSAFSLDPALTSVTFLRTAAPTVGILPFSVVVGATANVPYNATGFGANGSTWNNLIVTYGSAPAEDSGSSTPAVMTPIVEEAPDAEFNSKNRKYLSKREIKTMLDKNKTFKNYPIDKYKYSIFGTSKKICAIKGNFVVALKKTGACEMWVTRTTAKSAKEKYWVKINYSN